MKYHKMPHLCVVDQVSREDECSYGPHGHLRVLGLGDEDHDEADDDEEDKDAEEDAATHREVPLGLEGEDSESEDDDSRDASSNNDSLSLVKAANLQDSIH